MWNVDSENNKLFAFYHVILVYPTLQLRGHYASNSMITISRVVTIMLL